MSRNRNRIQGTMASNPSPRRDGSEIIPLHADVDVDGQAWAEAGDNLEELCSAFAASAFQCVQAESGFENPGVDAAELAVRLTTDQELADLNRQYRGIAKPTNVLSFAALEADGPQLLEGMPLFLGDIAIAAETVKREALEQDKPIRNHLAHMVVHGTLHLLGYDHEQETEALEMEALERRILGASGIGDPYHAQELSV